MDTTTKKAVQTHIVKHGTKPCSTCKYCQLVRGVKR